MNHLNAHNQHQWIMRRWKGQDWREPVVQACFGAEEAAAESINATLK